MIILVWIVVFIAISAICAYVTTHFFDNNDEELENE